VPHVFSTFERLLADRLVLNPDEIEDVLAKALHQRFREKVFYLDTLKAPADLRTIDLGSLAAELARALAAKAKRYAPPVAECVDDARIERARATLAEFDRVRRNDARIALLDLFEEAARLRMLLGEAEERLARRPDGEADREASAATPER
jgi:hypothetical protein